MFASQPKQNTNKKEKRGHDSQNKKSSNANRPSNPAKNDNRTDHNRKNEEKKVTDVSDKFKEVQRKHIEAAKKHIEAYESSDEEELESNALLESVFKNYNGEKTQLKKTQDFLENVFQCNTAACLICIATIKRTDYVSNLQKAFSIVQF